MRHKQLVIHLTRLREIGIIICDGSPIEQGQWL